MTPQQSCHRAGGWIILLSVVLACSTPTRSTAVLRIPPEAASSDRNDSYSDLQPLLAQIGSATVVGLGEPSHAEGNMFAMQSRIVHALHDKAGFTVLAWEASLWTCETDPANCVGWPWGSASETEDVRAIFKEPGVAVSGVDLQMTGRARDSSLNAFHQKLSSMLTLAPRLREAIDLAFTRFPKLQHFRLLAPNERTADRSAFVTALGALEGQADDPQVALIRQTVANVIALYDWHEAVKADVSTTIDWNHAALANVRDKAMAENLMWLRRTRYPGQKIVVWLASIHASRDQPFQGARRVGSSAPYRTV